MRQTLKNIVIAILSWEAKIVLKRHTPKVVAVTGSVGKTGTKDAIYTAIAHAHYARKSEKSFNSEFGIPLTILGLPTGWSSISAWVENIIEGFFIALFSRRYPEWLVLEVGADRPGDIQRLAWLAPHIVVYTHFPNVPVHVEYFESSEQVIEEKRALGKALRANGTLVVNVDDPKMQNESIHDLQQLVRYGFGEHADVRATETSIMYEHGKPTGMSAVVQFQNTSFPLTISGCIGVHQMYALLAAIASRVAEGVSLEHAVEALRGHTPPPGRMRILDGRAGSVLIDDTYNASPAAVQAGLDTLRVLQCNGRKIVILGDMMELGDHSVVEHKHVGEMVTTVCDVVITVGVRMLACGDVARARSESTQQQVHSYKETWEVIDALQDMVIGEGDIVYIKGSQSMRMERITQALLWDPGQAPFLLVRQEKEWLTR